MTTGDPEHLSDAQLEGRACLHCGHEPQPDEALLPIPDLHSAQSSQLFECADRGACARRVPVFVREYLDVPWHIAAPGEDRKAICGATAHGHTWAQTKQQEPDFVCPPCVQVDVERRLSEPLPAGGAA